jgi:V/A-type H+-transporting ATPase subunit D
VDAAEAEWLEAAIAAEEWLARAIVLSGGHRLRLARAYAGQAPAVTVRWRNTLGVDVPAEPELELAPPRDPTRVGGSAALAIAEEHHRTALRAAARHAALRTAHDRVTRELERTTRRLRAIERRWLPLHADALAALELTLDEAEREDTARARWASEHTAGSASRPV